MMRFCQWVSDGGKDSGVMGFFLIEIKSAFSIVLLRFKGKSRDAYHNHAFNAITLWFGSVRETLRDGHVKIYLSGSIKFTSRKCFHKVEPVDKPVWAISLRGPWKNTWQEDRNGKLATLTHGRKQV